MASEESSKNSRNLFRLLEFFILTLICFSYENVSFTLVWSTVLIPGSSLLGKKTNYSLITNPIDFHFYNSAMALYSLLIGVQVSWTLGLIGWNSFSNSRRVGRALHILTRVLSGFVKYSLISKYNFPWNSCSSEFNIQKLVSLILRFAFKLVSNIWDNVVWFSYFLYYTQYVNCNFLVRGKFS